MSETAPTGSSAADLLQLVRTGRATTRAELRRLTGLSRTAVVTRVSALVDSGLLLLGEELPSTGGRPPGALVFNQDAAVVAGAAIGRSRSQLGIFDLDGRELVGDTRDHEVGVGPDELMPDVAARLARLLEGIEPPVAGIGLSLPGSVDPVHGSSVDSPIMGRWERVPLAPYLAEVCDAPLLLANDTEALARSQLFPSSVVTDMLVLKASTGLGLGTVSGGRIVTGSVGTTGEIGHTRVPDADGLVCRCGATGCLETLAGGWALVQRMTRSGRPVAHVRELVALALEGDAVARGLLRDAGRQVGEVLAVAVNLLNPRAVVIGGDLAGAFDLFVAGVRESVYALATATAVRDLAFLPAAHGDSSGLVGCAALAIEHALRPEAVDARLTA
ncbi:ROK family protein [Nocardioides dongkuii]|uniref:ROK family protein n=1 Tax=Nocardioides dongkuii TaxID=2760089 RepID=UPI0015F8F103|nr:ROK family protein [Nocardioides dongkuii]